MPYKVKASGAGMTTHGNEVHQKGLDCRILKIASRKARSL